MIDNVVSRVVGFNSKEDAIVVTPVILSENDGFTPVAEFDSNNNLVVSSRQYSFYCYPTYTTANEVKLQAYTSELPYSVAVDWGDGNTSSVPSNGEITHTYSDNSSRQVIVTIEYNNGVTKVGQETVEIYLNVSF